jgi:heat-inducible transcriptional repressor
MEELTPRQIVILKAVVDDYIDSAKPVGSEDLVDKHNLKVSPATVRNEMAELMRKGYLSVPHTSAGRIPTTVGMRYYIQNLMDEKDVPVLQEVAIKQRIWQNRYESDKFLRQATLTLADISGLLSVIDTDDGRMYYSGTVNILEHPEFFDIDAARSLLGILDDFEAFRTLTSRIRKENDVAVIIGSEMERPHMDSAGMVMANFSCGNTSGRVSVVGPIRMAYGKIIPEIRFVKNLLCELGGGW